MSGTVKHTQFFKFARRLATGEWFIRSSRKLSIFLRPIGRVYRGQETELSPLLLVEKKFSRSGLLRARLNSKMNWTTFFWTLYWMNHTSWCAIFLESPGYEYIKNYDPKCQIKKWIGPLSFGHFIEWTIHHVLYFWKALGMSISKIMIPSVKYKNVQNPTYL